MKLKTENASYINSNALSTPIAVKMVSRVNFLRSFATNMHTTILPDLLQQRNANAKFGVPEVFILDPLCSIGHSIVKNFKVNSDGTLVMPASADYAPGYVVGSLSSIGKYYADLNNLITQTASSQAGAKVVAPVVSIGAYPDNFLRNIIAPIITGNANTLNPYVSINTLAFLTGAFFEASSNPTALSLIQSAGASIRGNTSLFPSMDGTSGFWVKLLRPAEAVVPESQTSVYQGKRLVIEAAIQLLSQAVAESTGETQSLLLADYLTLTYGYIQYLIISSEDVRNQAFHRIESIGSDLAQISSMVARLGALCAYFTKVSTIAGSATLSYYDKIFEALLDLVNNCLSADEATAVIKFKTSDIDRYKRSSASIKELTPMVKNAQISHEYLQQYLIGLGAHHVLSPTVIDEDVPTTAFLNNNMKGMGANAQFVAALGVGYGTKLFRTKSAAGKTMPTFTADYRYGVPNENVLHFDQYESTAFSVWLTTSLDKVIRDVVFINDPIRNHFSSPIYKEAEIYGTQLSFLDIYDLAVTPPVKPEPDEFQGIRTYGPNSQTFFSLTFAKFVFENNIWTHIDIPAIGKAPLDITARVRKARAASDKYWVNPFTADTFKYLGASEHLTGHFFPVPLCPNQSPYIIAPSTADLLESTIVAQGLSLGNTGNSDLSYQIAILIASLRNDLVGQGLINNLSSSFLIYEAEIETTEVDGAISTKVKSYKYPTGGLAPSHEYLFGIPVKAFYEIQEPDRADVQAILLPHAIAGKRYALARHSNLPDPALLIPLTSKGFPLGFYGSVVHKEVFMLMIHELQKEVTKIQKAEDFNSEKMIIERYLPFLKSFSYVNTKGLSLRALKQYYETLTPTPGQFLRNHAIDHTTGPDLSVLEHNFHVFKSQYADGISIAVEVPIEGQVITGENIALGEFSGVISNQSLRTLTTPLFNSKISMVKPLVSTPTEEEKNAPTVTSDANDIKVNQTPITTAEGTVEKNTDGTIKVTGDAKSTMNVIPAKETSTTVDGKIVKGTPEVSKELADNEAKRENSGDDGKNEDLNHRNPTTIETGNETENKL